MSGMSMEWKRWAPRCHRWLGDDDDSFLLLVWGLRVSTRAFLISGWMYD